MKHDLLTPNRRKKYEELGLDIVRQDLVNGGHVHIGGPDHRDALPVVGSRSKILQ